MVEQKDVHLSPLREHQNYNYLLNNHLQEDAGTLPQKRHLTHEDKEEATERQ